MDLVLEHMCRVASRIGKLPSHADMHLARKKDRSIPGPDVVARHGKKPEMVRRLSAFVKRRPDIGSLEPLFITDGDAQSLGRGVIGWVDMVSDGKRFKIGRTHSVEARIPELAAQNARPIHLVHKMEADDPAGIERYWHDRFAEKRTYGEWFELDHGDLAAFRRRRKFM